MSNTIRQGVTTICFCTVAYTLAYMHRICIAGITDLIQDRYAIIISKIGILTSTFFYTYSAFQLFAGISVDILQTRWIMLMSGLVIAIGSILLGFVPNFIAACVFRAIIGLGSAFIYVSTLKYASLWLSPRQFIIVTGALTAASGVAGVLGLAPLKHVADAIGLKWLFAGLGVFSLVVSVIIGIIGGYPASCYASRENDKRLALSEFKAGFVELRRSRSWVSLIPLLTYYFFFSGANYTISACLGAAFVTALNPSISQSYAVWMFTLQSVGLILIGLTVPHFAKHMGRKLPHILFPILLAGLMFCFAFLKENTYGWVFGVIYFMYGIFSGATIAVGYALCKELVPENVLATAIGLFNFAPALGGAIFQNTLPLILASNAVSEYRTVAFILAGQYLLCAFIGAFLKETAGLRLEHPRVKSRRSYSYFSCRANDTGTIVDNNLNSNTIPMKSIKMQA